MPAFIDLTGQRFGRLVVVAKEGKCKNGAFTWLCRCDCGVDIVVVGTSLRSGKTKSCGCLRSFERANEVRIKGSKGYE